MFGKEKEQIKAHNGLLVDFPEEKRKSRAATVVSLETLFREIGYDDYAERAVSCIDVMETAQLKGGYRPKNTLVRHAHGHVHRKYGWYPDLWAEEIARRFPLRKPGYDRQTMMKEHAICLFGMPYQIHIDESVNADLWGIKVVSTADVLVERHNARLKDFSVIRRAELVKILTGAGVSDQLADAVVKALEHAQLMGGLEKSTLLDSSLNRKFVQKIWKVLRSVCPQSDVALVRGFGASDAERLHCPFEIRLGVDGISVCADR